MDKPHIHILLVEDNPADVVLLGVALEQIASASFHMTAVERLKQGMVCLAERSFDVVLLDLGLPDSQGLATFTQLHAQAPEVPVVVLSGMQDEELAAEAVHAGAQDYLVKGYVDREVLARAIRYAIERHQLQSRIRASERYFRALIEHSADGVATLSADGTILYESPAALRMLGYLPDEMIGENSLAFTHPDDRALSSELFQQLLQAPHQSITSELRYRRKDGSWCWVEATGTNLLDIPGVAVIVVNYRDITARKQSEAAIRQLNETLELRIVERTDDLLQANAALARAARLKDEFLANMSHELRTPLNAILGRSELLREEIYGPLAARQAEALHSIDASGRHLLALINEILDLAKVEAGKLELQYETVAVEQICQTALHMVAQSAVQKRIAISTSLDPQVTTIYADERRLLQILINLLSNAVKFTPEGGAVGLEVRGDQEQQLVTFTIWDTGIGIAESDLARLFQPFMQIDSGLNRQYGGTGLGLALVQRLTQAHQGRVEVTSSLGHGSHFSVVLPWSAAAATEAMPAPFAHGNAATTQVAAVPGTGIPAISPSRMDTARGILLVEDNADQIQVMTDYLEAHGYRVSVAQNGGDALMLAHGYPPVLVLMDIQMPGMDGLETIRRMRLDPQLRTLPIIALTALALPGDRERCMAAGANAYMAKPVSLSELRAEIEARLGRGAGPTQVAAASP
ncbi:response regulator [Chloroflexales bacterium ZM16-3]|nr:response regulator [Chloroflexales bacterium ZM16-3]